MQRLIQLLYYYRAFLLFLFLEFICFFLIVQNNFYQRSVILNSSNSVIASIVNLSNNVQDYFRLNQVNQDLADEIVRLELELESYKNSYGFGTPDTLLVSKDSSEYQYIFEPAKVINNSTEWRNNTITINRGTKDGIEPGMGVIGGNGVVGQTKYVSKNYAVITSLLHANMKVSAKVENKIELATIEWDGLNYRTVKLRYVPRHYPVEKSDTVYTSGFNSIFPPGILIGYVESIELGDNASFFDIDVRLSNDFKSLSFVSVINNVLKVEKDSIESLIQRDGL